MISTRVCVNHKHLSKMVMGWLRESRTMVVLGARRTHVLLDLP